MRARENVRAAREYALLRLHPRRRPVTAHDIKPGRQLSITASP